MARMHSRKKGKSGSTKPVMKVPSWAPYKDKEVEKLVIKFAKTGMSASEIGLKLRDDYGINSIKALTGKKLGKVLKENNLSKELPEDLLDLIRKMVALKVHFEKNKQDMTSKRGMLLTNSKIRRLIKYYQNSKRLPDGWKFNPEEMKKYLE